MKNTTRLKIGLNLARGFRGALWATPAGYGAEPRKLAGLIPVGRQLFRIACFEVVAVLVTLAEASALAAFRPDDSTQTIKY